MDESVFVNNFKSFQQLCAHSINNDENNRTNRCENTINKIIDTNCNIGKTFMHSSQLNTKSLKRMNYRKYRSGSSSDSAITFENSFEKEDNVVNTEPSDLFEDFNIVLFDFSCVALQRKISLNSAIFKRFMSTTKRYYKHFDSDLSEDKFGFFVNSVEGESKEENTTLLFLEWITSELLNSRSLRYWSIGCKSIKCLVRECGIPNDLRQQIWLTLIQTKLDENINIEDILDQLNQNCLEKKYDDVLNQIDLDVSRTFPNHVMFSGCNNEGLTKLRRLLIGYCVYVNPHIGYCQGMNFIAAFLLIVFEGNENHSLMGLICIINHYFPPQYYDQHLTGARADQMLLKDLISTNMDKNVFTNNVIDEITCSLTLNWFLSLYHSSLPWQIRLYVMDCFWLEGVKVLFRFSLALIKMAINGNPTNPQQPEFCCGELLNAIRDTAKNCYDMFELQQIAFNEIKLPKRKYMAARRSFYVKQIDLMNKNRASNFTVSQETTSQWIRRKSNEILGFQTGKFINWKIVSSDDRTKCVVCRTQKNICEFTTFSLTDSSQLDSCSWFMRNVSLVGISNCAQNIICTHFSSKNLLKTKHGLHFDIIGVSVNICETFYLERFDMVLILCFNGSILKYCLTSKHIDKSMIANDKMADIISAKLDKLLSQVWVDTVCKTTHLHQFFCFDVNSLDVFTIIKTDCLNIYQFGIFYKHTNQEYNINPIIVVKTNPCNGKLVKTISVLSDNESNERIYDSDEELYHLDCFRLNSECDQLSTGTVLLDNIIVAIVKSQSSIAIEYKYKNIWRKKPLLIEQFNDISDIIAIKTMAIKEVNSELIISLAVCTSENNSLINMNLLID